jgi:hypothetical protein
LPIVTGNGSPVIVQTLSRNLHVGSQIR